MTARRLLLLTVAGLCLAMVVLAMLACGEAVRAGTIRVAIHEKGPGGAIVSLPVPVALVEAGVRYADNGGLAEAARSLRPWSPMIHAVLSSLQDAPDALLVEVIEAGERVAVAKSGRSLLIDVESRDESVHLSIPIRSVGSILRGLESRSGRV